MTEWKIEPRSTADPVAVAIVREYLTDIIGRYFGRQATAAEVDQEVAADPGDLVVFLVATADGEPAGCAGLRMIEPGVAELKRMFVRERHRRRGLARRLIGAAEDHARELGALVIQLDTRDDLTEARGLYAATGYAEISPRHEKQYADHWFEKTLHLRAPAGRNATVRNMCP